MPWGALIIGAFLVAAVTVGMSSFVTGTSSIDTTIKTGVPLAAAGIYGIVLLFGLFGGKD